MITLILSLVVQAHAYTDQRCAAQCRARGSAYAWCESRCQYDPMPAFQPAGYPDRACVAQCQRAGYNFMFCQQRCAQ